MSYSQHDEERYILEHAPPVGRFLDIGAFHPMSFSNTRALYERGWSGVMVEPSPLPFDSLLREYGTEPRITLILAAAAVESGLVRLHVTQGTFSTSEDWWFNECKSHAGFYGDMLVPAITFEDLRPMGPFDFVSIDTEGTSLALLDECVRVLSPPCVCAEVHCKLDGYELVYESETNCVFIKA